MKIIGFVQLHNELEKGNLFNWIKCVNTVCDHVYIYDQASSEENIKIYNQYNNFHVIKSKINNFKNELFCKNELFNKVNIEHPDWDFMLGIDGDIVLDGRLLKNNGKKFGELCVELKNKEIDLAIFGHYNMWRSDIHYRIDNGYHNLHNRTFPLWRNNGKLFFDCKPGLHHGQVPEGTKTAIHTDACLIHRGFATDDQIITKYDLYKSHGQKGWDLDRLLDESTLKVEEINRNIIPEWYNIVDTTNPLLKEKIKTIYNKQHEK